MSGGNTRIKTTVFAGYNHTLRSARGEWYDMRNVTGQYYPVFSQRKKRGSYAKVDVPCCLLGKDKLAYIDNCTLYYDGKEVLVLNAEKDKSMVSFGANIVIFPDKVMYNTVTGEVNELENISDSHVATPDFQGAFDYFSVIPCDRDGNAYNEKYIITTSCPSDWSKNYEEYYFYYSAESNSGFYKNDGTAPDGRCQTNWQNGFFYFPSVIYNDEAPASAEDGVMWCDTTDGKRIYKKYSSTLKMWVTVNDIYFKISSNVGLIKNLGKFAEGDVVDISLKNNETYSLEGKYTVVKSDGNYIICEGVVESSEHAEGTISRTVPDMDFVIEGENRLWGCRYGKDNDGNFVNEIYACALGDPTNWRCYRGTSMDSYAVSVGSDGAFTGAIFYAGYPTFFKERYIHRIGGSTPSSYAMYTTAADGVQKGSEKSLAVVNGALFYKSPTDIMAYTGSYPSSVSASLADNKYYGAAAGEISGRYYVSMKDSENKYRLFVYDTLRGLWHIEDDTHALAFARVSDTLYMMTESDILAIDSDIADEEDFTWYAQTGIMDFSPDKGYVNSISVQAQTGEGAYMDIYIEYDSSGKWERVGGIIHDTVSSECITIMPKRCDHYALKFEGKGEIKIYSISENISEGSDKQWK